MFFEKNSFKKDTKLCLIFTDEDVVKRQRGVLGHMVKQLGSNLIHGKSIIDISLPIKIFEEKSFIEKIAMLQVFAPIYLEKAAGIPQNNFEQAL